MKITISIPDELYDKLEADRGLIPRSTYIQELIDKGGEVTVQVDTKTDKPYKRTKGKEEWVEPEGEFKTYFKNDKIKKG